MDHRPAFVFSAHEELAERRQTFAYWLAHCEGFSVESPGGRVGLVQDVRCSLDSCDVNALVVRCGRLGRQVVVVPVHQIEAVVPRETRIILRRDPLIVPPRRAARGRPELRLVHGGRDVGRVR